ncbi:GDP-L-fucose synthase [Campylobacter upsaliensis]|uniref:GDP-L-fucose synthase family protein n=1 Tax=Campylobacter upsaliensis TaxID=28080 RepID=UPI002B374A51|nr:GDP-L-fucose synthase [Campylobacter upsaliensis]MEB2817727.1 GDP-L-fucose synthase [Campylobacter upsaliensis]
MDKNAKIYLAGHRGLVGSAILQELEKQGFTQLIYKTHAELDLTNQKAVEEFFAKEKPEFVILAAAKAGGIAANSTYRADFIYENLMIEANVIHAAYKNGVKKLIFIASTTIYPKNASLPTSENEMLKGDLEYTNKPYAIAKIAGCMLCESYNLQYSTNFIALSPTNLYGSNDKFDLEKAHVMPALLRKMHLAKLLNEGRFEELLKDLDLKSLSEARAYLAKFGVSEESVEIWGDGTPTREFIHSEDLAKAVLFILKNVDFKDLYQKDEKEIQNTHINVAPGENISIKDLANLVKEVVGFKGTLFFNTARPNGAMQKHTSGKKLENLGFKVEISLKEGVRKMYQWYHTGGGGVSLPFYPTLSKAWEVSCA